MSGDKTTSNNIIQDINQLVTHKETSVITVDTKHLDSSNYTSIVVSEGDVEKFTTTAFSTPTNGSGALDANAPVIFSAELFNDLFYADGKNTKYYDGATDTVKDWSSDLTAGSLPGSSGKRARLVEMWRSRIVLSGVREDPHNWFMSELGDPFNWDYAPSPATVTQAVAGNNATAGKVGDVVNSMCPYDDDTLIFFGDHTIWQMTGDPAEGGRIDLISDITGAMFGRPWCKGPQGEIYFIGSRGGVYRMSLGNKPERISSGRIEEMTNDIDKDGTIIRAAFDDRTQLVHFFITPLDTSAAYITANGKSTHIIWDLRHEAFWFDQFNDQNYNPRAVHVMEGDAPGDRVVILGSNDGFLRYIDYTAKKDDQKRIDSYVFFGPWQLDEGRRVQLREMIFELDLDADSAYYEVYGGNSAMAAFPDAEDNANREFHTARKLLSGTLKAGRNSPERRRCSDRTLYLKLGNSTFDEAWSYETAYIFLLSSGISRLRQKRN